MTSADRKEGRRALLSSVGTIGILALGWFALRSDQVSPVSFVYPDSAHGERGSGGRTTPLELEKATGGAVHEDPVASYCRAAVSPCRLFVARYGAVGESDVSPALRGLRESGVLTAAASALNDVLALPVVVELVVHACGDTQAFYEPGAHRVSLCTELVDETGREVERAFPRVGDRARARWRAHVVAASTYFLYHEVAHAVMHVLELPVTGRTEDAADQLALKLLLTAGDSAAALNALFAASSLFLAWSREARAAPEELSGVHALPLQRHFNAECWGYALDRSPENRAYGQRLVPEDRREQCDEEWAQISSSWDRLLAPHLRLTVR